MSSTRSSAGAQPEFEALVVLAAGIDRRRAAAVLDAAFVDCVLTRRRAIRWRWRARIRPAGARAATRLN